jgi:hypothetical protein
VEDFEHKRLTELLGMGSEDGPFLKVLCFSFLCVGSVCFEVPASMKRETCPGVFSLAESCNVVNAPLMHRFEDEVGDLVEPVIVIKMHPEGHPDSLVR